MNEQQIRGLLGLCGSTTKGCAIMNKFSFEELQEICNKLFAQSNNYFNPLDEIMVGFGEFIPKDTAYCLGEKLRIDGRTIVLLSSDIRGVLEEAEAKIGYRIRRVPEGWVRFVGLLLTGNEQTA